MSVCTPWREASPGIAHAHAGPVRLVADETPDGDYGLTVRFDGPSLRAASMSGAQASAVEAALGAVECARLALLVLSAVGRGDTHGHTERGEVAHRIDPGRSMRVGALVSRCGRRLDASFRAAGEARRCAHGACTERP